MISHTLQAGQHLVIGGVRLTVLAVRPDRVIFAITPPADAAVQVTPQWTAATRVAVARELART